MINEQISVNGKQYNLLSKQIKSEYKWGKNQNSFENIFNRERMLIFNIN